MVGRMLSKLFEPLIAKVLGALSLVLLLALGVQTARLSWAQRDAASYKLASETLKKSYTAAQAAAEAEQKAYYASISARYSDKARFADESNRIAQDRSRGAVSAYAERMRLNPSCVPGKASGGTQDRPAEDRDGQGDATEFVAVTRNDFEVMVANGIRLEEVRKWGESLITEGLAVPDPSFAKP